MKINLFTAFVVIALIMTVVTFYHNWPLGSAREAKPAINPQASIQPVVNPSKSPVSSKMGIDPLGSQDAIKSEKVRNALNVLNAKTDVVDFRRVDSSQEITQLGKTIIGAKLSPEEAYATSMIIYQIWTKAEDRSVDKADLSLKNEQPFFAMLSSSLIKAKDGLNSSDQEVLSNAKIFLGCKYLEKDDTNEGFKWLQRAGVSGDKALAMHLALKARRESNQPP